MERDIILRVLILENIVVFELEHILEIYVLIALYYSINLCIHIVCVCVWLVCKTIVCSEIGKHSFKERDDNF